MVLIPISKGSGGVNLNTAFPRFQNAGELYKHIERDRLVDKEAPLQQVRTQPQLLQMEGKEPGAKSGGLREVIQNLNEPERPLGAANASLTPVAMILRSSSRRGCGTATPSCSHLETSRSP